MWEKLNLTFLRNIKTRKISSDMRGIYRLEETHGYKKKQEFETCKSFTCGKKENQRNPRSNTSPEAAC